MLTAIANEIVVPIHARSSVITHIAVTQTGVTQGMLGAFTSILARISVQRTRASVSTRAGQTRVVSFTDIIVVFIL